MTETIIRRGKDSWVGQNNPNAEHGSGRWVKVQGGGGDTKRGFLYMPLPGVLGRTVLSATLTGHAGPDWDAQTISVRRVSESWGAAALNWNNQPGVTGATATETTGALAEGDEITIDVTDLVQQVANGVAWYGFRLTTDATEIEKFYSFDTGQASWTLTVELSDVPDTPEGLAPDGGSVSSGSPILSWDYADLGGTATDQAELQVQVDPDADEVSPGFDSGWVVSTEPELDLSGTAYAGLAADATTQWRVRVKSAAGVESEWSDWVSFTHTAKPTLTVDQPASGLIYDPTPPIEAHITGGTLTSWRIKIASGTDKTDILYDSGRRDATHATDIAHTLPLRNAKGERIFRDDSTYQLLVRAWDDVDRAEGVTGDPTYVQDWSSFTFDDDAAVEAPADFTVTQDGVSPRLTFSWTRSVDPDAWLITDAGKFYARIDAADVPEVGGVYSWTDSGFSDPWTAHNWRVRAIVANRKSDPSALVTLTTEVEGVWLIRSNGDSVMLSEVADLDRFITRDRRATYQPLNNDMDVDIIYAQEGVSGSFTGVVYDHAHQDIDEALPVLEAIKNHPRRPVQMVWANKSVPVLLRDLTVLPASDFVDHNRKHQVSFGFFQVGDFDVEDL